MGKLGFLAVVLLTCTLGNLSAAPDQWDPPSTAFYPSKNKVYKFVVYPTKLTTSPESPNGAILMGETDSCCRGRMVKVGNNEKEVTIWQGPLRNPISPVSAMVTDDGKFVVTFDDWHSVGMGSNVVVIYGNGGRTIANFSLSDFLNEEQINRLIRTTTSRWWEGEHCFSPDSKLLILQVKANEKQIIDDDYTGKQTILSEEDYQKRLKYQTIVLDLGTGRVIQNT